MATYDLRNNIPSASDIRSGDILNAPFNNQSFTVTLPKGTYTIEAWGGAGVSTNGGRGGYAKGTLSLQAQTTAYLVPGNGKFSSGQSQSRINGGSRYGGDASDVRLIANSVNNRIIVAGGGGNSGFYGSANVAGGYGGGSNGGVGAKISSADTAAGGGTQTAGGAGGAASSSSPYYSEAVSGQAGTFGNGGYPDGGGGWYGGGGRFYRYNPDDPDAYMIYGGGAGGGSGFVLNADSVSNVPSAYASALKNSQYYLVNTQLIDGTSSMPNPSGGTMTGNDGSGYVRITVDSLPLPPPSNLTSSNLTENSVTLSWTASTVSGATYKVLRGTTQIASTTSTSITDSGIQPGTTYTYTVYATKTGYSNSTSITLSVTNKPKLSTPVLAASYTLDSTTISWGAVSGTNVSYKVWRGSTYIGVQVGTSYTDNSAGSGSSYTYKVTAIGTNAYDSNQASINTNNAGQLATPTSRTTTYTETSTTISWNAVTNATSYKVWRGDTLLTSSNTSRTYTDTSSSAGIGHSNTYYVSATASGYYESEKLIIETANLTKLATPTGLAATHTATSTTITWNAVTNATAYKVWRGTTLLTSNNTARSYTDTSSSAGAGKTNTYYVAATASGYYESEQASISTTNPQRFSTPTNLTVTYTKTSTKISWSKVTSPATATVYNVWRGSTSLGTVTSSSSTISYTDSSAYGASGKSNTYYVSAAASSSYYESAKASIKTSNPPTLAAPILQAEYAKTQTTIVWNTVANATSYKVYRSNTLVATQADTSYVDSSASAGTSYTYKVIASNSPAYYDSPASSITTHNPSVLSPITNLTASQTVSSVTLTWTASANATKYVVTRETSGGGSVDVRTVVVSNTSYTDTTTQPGTRYLFSVTARADGYYDSSASGLAIDIYPRQPVPALTEARQTTDSVTLSITNANGSALRSLVIRRDGVIIATFTPGMYPTFVWTYTDSGLEPQRSYVYTAYSLGQSGSSYDSEQAVLVVYLGKVYTQIERQRSYLRALKLPFFKLCRLRFLYPNGTTAFALDNNIRNRRSKAFIQDGTVNANMQNGQRLTASVTIANANHEFDFNLNKIWFGQEVALDEGLVLPNGEEYWHQTGVFVIDNPQETINPNNKTVTYNLVDKWADLDGTLDGNLEGTYEVDVNTNIYNPIASLLAEDRGNGRPTDRIAPVFTEYFNSRTQQLPDGTTASMVLSPYTLTVDGDGGTIGEVVLGLAGMVNAWVGYDNTGRLRIEPSQDDILDTQKAVLYRFSPEEVTLLGMAYTIKKEDVHNDYIVVGEQMDDYTQPAGRAQNLDPRSDTNVLLIGRKTNRESASGFATVQQCKDLAEWRLKRAGVLQKAVNFSCSQMFHIELNSLVEVVRTDKPGSPTERHLIQGYSRPLANNGAMTISAVSTVDYPIATVTEWPPA